MDPNLKKQVLRTFTYGLYALSSANEGEVNICTVNWLTQVSFDPPLVAVSIEKASKTLPMVLRSRKFMVNVLRSGDRELAGKLGKSAMQHPDKLAGIGFDIPVDTVNRIVPELIRSGKIIRPGLGIHIADDQIARRQALQFETIDLVSRKPGHHRH